MERRVYVCVREEEIGKEMKGERNRERVGEMEGKEGDRNRE